MSILLEANENIEKFEKDEILFKQGDLPESFYLIVSGKISCYKKFNDRIVPIYMAGPKEIVGEECVLLDAVSYFYSAVVLEDCEVIRIEKSEVFAFLQTQNEWIKNILKNISEKIQHTTELIAEHRILDPKLMGDEDFTDEREALLKKYL